MKFRFSIFPVPGPLAVLFILLITGFFASCTPEHDLPGETEQRISVPDGFSVEQVAGPDLVDYPTFATFDDRGRLFVIESTRANTMTTEEMREDPHHRVKILEDSDGDGIYDQSKIYAENLPFPEGGLWHNGSFYVAAAPDLIRFKDSDGDGRADLRETVISGWTLSVNGAVLSGPFMGPDGWFYLADARRGFEITTKEGEVLKGAGARIWRLRPDGTGLESIAGGGFDNAVELAFTPAGETIGTMTYFVDPRAGQRDALMHWVEGGVYPKPHPVIEEDRLVRTGPLMPVMTKLARIAHSGLTYYDNPHFGKEYRGNLFTAQFNTGRVMRYRMSRDGATFETTEETFLHSDDPDFHPTDVLADADGSLLVVNTGGWFIKGCPLSRVAKPDVDGGIWRIRRTDGDGLEDPWGRTVDFGSMDADDLARFLTDRRPKVREQAVERLVSRGNSAVEALRQLLQTDASEKARTSAVFALYRIGTPVAMEEVRKGLTDISLQVRVAAARSTGLAGDKKAVPRLMELVENGEPAVRRQAATALGQIGDARAVPSLLAAAAKRNDRIAGHAITYALIRIGSSAPLLEALDRNQPGLQKTALIALDQMKGAPLERRHLAPFLASRNRTLYEAGLWVVSHHPEWSDLVLSLLRRRLQVEGLSHEDADAMTDLAVSFCEDKGVQQLLAELLEDPDLPDDRKQRLLDVMNRCPVEELPRSWIRPLANLVQPGSAADVRARVIAIAESRELKPLQDELKNIAADTEEALPIRLKSLGALVSIRHILSDDQYRLLAEQLGPGADAALRQSAARVIAGADLSESQLIRLARQQLPGADPFVLTRLVEPFKGDSTARVGDALVEALGHTTGPLESLSEQNLRDLFGQYPPSTQKRAQPLLQALRKRQQNRLEQLQKIESQLTEGDVGAGRNIFFGSKAICSTCHAVGGEGGDFGPDLSNIGEIRSRHDLLEAILYPSVSFAREHETFEVKTRGGTYRGIIAEQNPDRVILNTGPDSQVRISREEIESIDQVPTSMMPPRLDRGLSNRELSDLVAFLEALPNAARWNNSR